MKYFFFTILILASTFTISAQDKTAINNAIDKWHKAAADADFNTYFNLMTTTSVFVGTDATEHWGYEDFKAYAKPHFDKGKAWSFIALQRHVFTDPSDPNIAWFDEVLDTQMELCRGSGVVKNINGQWKIQHYVLSIAVPNETVSELITLKKEADSTLVKTYFKKRNY